jgi:hypothetical protein
MVARVDATSKCREKTKVPIMAKEPKEITLPYLPLYLPLPPSPSSTLPSPALEGKFKRQPHL